MLHVVGNCYQQIDRCSIPKVAVAEKIKMIDTSVMSARADSTYACTLCMHEHINIVHVVYMLRVRKICTFKGLQHVRTTLELKWTE